MNLKIAPGTFVLAPLTRGGNLPFRRLCRDFGVDITVSEMAYARSLVKGERREYALLRKHSSESIFGAQIAAKDPQEAVKAGLIAAELGADFLDINCGCPIHDTTRRGLGAELLRKPGKIEAMVQALVKALPIPVTVKVRLGWDDTNFSVFRIAELVEAAGASLLTVHGRTREQRYTRAADWAILSRLVQERSIPICGNGDILTYYEADARQQVSGCPAQMIGRGALIKPWIFKELKDKADYLPSARERLEIYYTFTRYLQEHFRTDEKGKKRAMYFLPWHFSFFCRYRPLPFEQFQARSLEYPLIQDRIPAVNQEELDPLLNCTNEAVHLQMAEALWESASLDECYDAFMRITLPDNNKESDLELDQLAAG